MTNYREWGERFDERMAIRRRVMDILGISLPKKIQNDQKEAVRQSMIGCVTCGHTRSCASWIRIGDGSAGPPAFCPNRAVFQKLMDAEPA